VQATGRACSRGAVLSELGIEYLLTYGQVAKHYHDSAHVTSACITTRRTSGGIPCRVAYQATAVLDQGVAGAWRWKDVVSFLMQRLAIGARCNCPARS